jgi:NAD(P)H dehydrogenase (quinone)
MPTPPAPRPTSQESASRAGSGKVAPATRDDLAHAHAVVLAETGHENQTYLLHGDPGISFADAARILSDISGATVPYIPVTDEEFIPHLLARGMAQPSAEFFIGWMHGINNDECDGPSGDLERLIEHKPMATPTFLRHSYSQL